MVVRKGPWSGEEDLLLRRYIEEYGEGNWHLVSQRAGLNRCRKSCRLRWVDYLNPDVNREEFKEDELNLIIRMHKLLGNRWSLIAGRLPGRTACHIKNYWNSHLKNRVELSSDYQFTFPSEPKRHQVFKPQPRYFASKQISGEFCISNIHQTRQQYDILPATGEEPDRWWNDFLLHADVNPDQNTYLIDANGGLWDDIASMNNWLMED